MHKPNYLSALLAAIFLTQAQASHAEPIAFRHARLIDGNGGAPVENATLVLDNGRITALGPDDAITVPEGARVIDLAGKSVLPGLIAAHSHLGMTDGTTSGPENYTRYNITRQLKQFQRYGVTTVTSLGLNGPLFQELREQAHAGALPGADVFGADRGIGAPNGAPPMNVGPDQLYRPTTPEEARAAVREMAARKPDLVKIWVDDFHGTLPVKVTPEVYTAVIDECHKHGLRAAAHVYYLNDAKSLIAAGVDILAHGVRDRPVDDAFINAMKSTGTWYIPTLGLDESFYIYAQQPEWTKTAFFRDALQPQLAAQFDDAEWRRKTIGNRVQLLMNQNSLRNNLANLKRLHDAGINIGFGTDSGATPLRIPGFAEHREFMLMIEAGLTPLQAITLATRNAAALLKLDDRGVLAPDKRADLLIVTGNPAHSIADLHQIDSVWQAGKQVTPEAK